MEGSRDGIARSFWSLEQMDGTENQTLERGGTHWVGWERRGSPPGQVFSPLIKNELRVSQSTQRIPTSSSYSHQGHGCKGVVRFAVRSSPVLSKGQAERERRGTRSSELGKDSAWRPCENSRRGQAAAGPSSLQASLDFSAELKFPSHAPSPPAPRKQPNFTLQLSE